MYFLSTGGAEKAFQTVHFLFVHVIGLEGKAELVVCDAVVKDWVVHPKAKATDDVENYRHADGTKKYGQLESDGDKGWKRPIRLATKNGWPITLEKQATTKYPGYSDQCRQGSSKAEQEADYVETGFLKP